MTRVDAVAGDEDLPTDLMHPPVTRLRVLYLTHVDRVSGAERSLLDLLSTLDRCTFEAVVLLPRKGELSDFLEAQEISCRYCSRLERLYRPRRMKDRFRLIVQWILGSIKVFRELRRGRYQLVHANTTTAALYALFGTCLLRIPLIWHLRDLVPLGFLGRILALRSARIVATSDSVSRLAQSFARAGKIDQIPNGIQIVSVDELDESHSTSTTDSFIVLSVGQLVPWKGFDLLPEVAKWLIPRFPQIRFWVVGDDLFGDEPAARSILQQRIQDADLESFFRLFGYQDDMKPFYTRADVLAHTAYPEPFGRVVVEAMAAELPVVAFDGLHGPSEIIRDGVDGFLVPLHDAKAMSDALGWLHENQEKGQIMGAQGRIRAETLFDRRLMARRIETLYSTILNGKKHDS